MSKERVGVFWFWLSVAFIAASFTDDAPWFWLGVALWILAIICLVLATLRFPPPWRWRRKRRNK